MKVLLPESMKPSKLKRHLETKHTDCKDKNLLFFERKANCVKRSQMDSSGVFQQRNRASVEATFVISLRIAKAKKPHTIAEQLILPCAKDINRILIGKEAESKLNVLSLSDNTVQRRISLMSEDIKNQVIDQMKSAGLFALQLNESRDVSSCAQLIAFVRYVHKGVFKDEFLCIVDLPSTTRGEDIFKTIDAFFKANDIKWEQLCGLCTDGALAMLGHSSGFHAHVNTFSAVGRSGTSLEKMHTVRSDVPERLCNSCNAFGAKNVLKRLFSKRHWSVYVGMSQDILHTRLYKGFEGSQMLSFDDRRKK